MIGYGCMQGPAEMPGLFSYRVVGAQPITGLLPVILKSEATKDLVFGCQSQQARHYHW